MMRVTHVVNDLNTGGAQTLIEALAAASRPDIATSVVVLSGEGVLSSRIRAVAADVIHLGFERSSNRLDRLAREVRAAVLATTPDVVHAHLLQSDLAVLLARLPRRVARVSTVHTTGLTASDPLRSRAFQYVAGVGGRSFDAVVACSPQAREHMLRTGYSARNAHVIVNGIAIGSTPGSTPRRGTLLSLSRWHPMKDHASLFAAFAIARSVLPELRLVCAGSGVDERNEPLGRLIAEHGVGDAVTLLGPITDVPGLLAEADALVISSAYGEAMPMAGLEALAAGAPVITTDVGNSAALAADPAFVVHPSDPGGLADAILRLETLPDDEYLTLRARSRTIVEASFSIDACAASYRALYESALVRRRA
ncbi:MAG: glycosyltransferase [Microbacterium sp.]|nr:glycosyltransferase [Microbacterium sp.]